MIFDSRYLEAWLPNRRERWMSRAALMTSAMAGWLYLMMVWVSKVGLVRGESCSKTSGSCSISSSMNCCGMTTLKISNWVPGSGECWHHLRRLENRGLPRLFSTSFPFFCHDCRTLLSCCLQGLAWKRAGLVEPRAER